MYIHVVRNIEPLENLTAFIFYSMVDKCMTQWQKFSLFWQQAGHVEIYIVLDNITNQVR